MAVEVRVAISRARRELAGLVRRVHAGEMIVVITRSGWAIARLVPPNEAQWRGAMQGPLPAAFLEALADKPEFKNGEQG